MLPWPQSLYPLGPGWVSDWTYRQSFYRGGAVSTRKFSLCLVQIRLPELNFIGPTIVPQGQVEDPQSISWQQAS